MTPSARGRTKRDVRRNPSDVADAGPTRRRTQSRRTARSGEAEGGSEAGGRIEKVKTRPLMNTDDQKLHRIKRRREALKPQHRIEEATETRPAGEKRSRNAAGTRRPRTAADRDRRELTAAERDRRGDDDGKRGDRNDRRDRPSAADDLRPASRRPGNPRPDRQRADRPKRARASRRTSLCRDAFWFTCRRSSISAFRERSNRRANAAVCGR